MELNRVSSHLVALATGGMEIGALTVMTVGFRERERILSLFEMITGLRMNHAFIRPGGLSQDLPPGAIDAVREAIPLVRKGIRDIEKLSNENPLVKARLVDVGYLDLTGCMALGITGPVLRSTGLPHDLRKSEPYWRLRDLRLRRPDLGLLRCLRAAADPDQRDVRVAEDRRAVPGPAGRGRPGPGVWSATARSPGRPSWPSAATGWATAWTTSRRSWVPRWRP